MKLVWLLILILGVGFGLFWKQELRQVPSAPAPKPTAGVARIPPSVGVPLENSPSPLLSTKPSVAEDLAPRLEKVAELARIALPTQDSRAHLIRTLSDQELHQYLGRVLKAGDHHEYDVTQEKQRMNAVSVLGLIIRYKEVSQREELVSWVRQRILTVDFHKMKDPRVKQSVYGDITELLMILKQYDSESYEDLSQRIGETNSKVLKTALAASR